MSKFGIPNNQQFIVDSPLYSIETPTPSSTNPSIWYVLRHKMLKSSGFFRTQQNKKPRKQKVIEA